MSVKALLTRPDLSGCLQLECNIAEDGASHSRRGANYGANQDTNSMAAHLNNEHPEYSRDPLAIKFSVTKTGPKCLERQVREAFQLANMKKNIENIYIWIILKFYNKIILSTTKI